jgi:hypothetical protein
VRRLADGLLAAGALSPADCADLVLAANAGQLLGNSDLSRQLCAQYSAVCALHDQQLWDEAVGALVSMARSILDG